MIHKALLLNPLNSLPSGYVRYFFRFFLKRKIEKHLEKYEHYLNLYGYMFTGIELKDRTYYVIFQDNGREIKKPVCVICQK